MKERIVAIGDSITWGFPYGIYDSWVQILSDEFDNYVWINQGINGDTFEGILYRLNHDVVAEAPLYCIITAGINDVFMGFSLESLQNTVKKIVRNLKERNIIPILGIPINIMVIELDHVLNSFQEWLKAYAQENSIHYIDFRGMDSSDFCDDVHPNSKGYKKMSEKALAVFREILK